VVALGYEFVHVQPVYIPCFQSSGVGVDDKCLEVFQELKLKKKYKYITYKLSADNKDVVVEKTAEQGTYDDFIKALPTSECRYAIFDFEFEKPGEGIRNKICFYAW
jgi:cofilin